MTLKSFFKFTFFKKTFLQLNLFLQNKLSFDKKLLKINKKIHGFAIATHNKSSFKVFILIFANIKKTILLALFRLVIII